MSVEKNMLKRGSFNLHHLEFWSNLDYLNDLLLQVFFL